MKPLIYLFSSLFLISNVFAQDYEKGESSYMYYEGTPSKTFQSLYGKTSKSSSKGGTYQSYAPNVVKLGMLEVLGGRPTIYFERVLYKAISIEVGVGVNFKPFVLNYNNGFLGNVTSDVIETIDDYDYTVSLDGLYGKNPYGVKRDLGFHYSIAPKFYTNGVAPKGFYVSPAISHSFSKFTVDHSYMGEAKQTKESSKEFGIGGGIGTQFIVASKVSIDLNIMFYYTFITQERYVNELKDMYTVKGKLPQLMYSVKIGGIFGNKKKDKE